MDKIKLYLTKFFNKYPDRCSFVLFISKIIFFLVLLLFLVLAGSYSIGKPLLYFNTTDSAVRGIYISSFSDGYDYDDFFVVRLSNDYGHLKRGQYLLKQLKGKPGDIYISRYNYVSLNGHRYSLLENEKLPRMPYGAYMIPKGYFMMLNERDHSFDGRYIGPTKKENLVQKVNLLVNRDLIFEKQKAFRDFLCGIFPSLENVFKTIDTN